MPILAEINREAQEFQYKNIQIVPSFPYNQYATIQKIIFYYNSKFKTGEVDDEGDRKYFYNINKNACKIFTKSIDFDTKNIRMLTAGGGDPLKTWFMERDLKYWMRDQQFGKVLNRIFFELPIYGSVVLKIVDGKPFFVDLRNFIIEQSADTIESANYVTEIHPYTPADFRKVAKTMKWKDADVKKVIELYHQMKDTSHIRVYERYGEVEETDLKGNKTYNYKRVFIADVGVDEYDQYNRLTLKHSGVELASEDWEGTPYWEFHVGKIPGRWLGVGVVETLFEPQIRHNEIANLQAKASYWAALRVFQTRDGTVNRNIMTDVSNGEILNTDSEITQVDMSDRNLAFFNEETEKWNKNIDSLTIAFAPVGHSVIAIQIAQDQVVSYFKQIQQEVALDIKEMIYAVIIPQFEKESSTEHTLRLVGQDLDQFIAMIKNELVFKEVLKQIILNGKWPTQHDSDVIGVAIEEAIKQGKEKIVTVPKGFYKGIKYGIDIDILGESIDTQALYAAKQSILQAITADPTMTTDPVKKKILYSMAEDAGLNASEIFGVESKQIADLVSNPQMPQNMPRGAGGGVSAPTSMGTSMGGQAQRTL